MAVKLLNFVVFLFSCFDYCNCLSPVDNSILEPVPTVATTVASSSVPYMYDCNFEQGFCNWSQTISDDFDWTRTNGRFHSSDTGPTTDHTTGTNAGFYVFIESYFPRKPNQKAQIISANIVTTTTKCLRFWYHMYGSNIETLNVYLKSSTTPGTLYWTRKGSLSDKWYQAQVDIQENSTYQIMFEAVVGHGEWGDIAVDDITVREGSCAGFCGDVLPNCKQYGPTVCIGTYKPWASRNCANYCKFCNVDVLTSSTFVPVSTVVTTVAPSPAPSIYDCNFEQNLCSWSQGRRDEFDWTRLNGPTSSAYTGPTNDHTTGTSAGYYIYIETSSPRRFNDKAQLFSANIVTTSTKCLRFWYQMYGSEINTLNVYLYNSTALGIPIWTHFGNQGNKWYQTQVDIQGYSTYQIMFEGVRGNSARGDIAVDDISVREGSCPAPSQTMPVIGK